MDEAPPVNNRRRYVVVSIVLGLVFLAGGSKLFGGLAAMKKESEKKAGARLPELVRTSVAATQNHVETVIAYGRARPRRITAVSAEVGARVTWVEPKLEVGQAFAMPEGAPGQASGPEMVRLDAADFGDQLTKLGEDLVVFDRQLEQLATLRQSIADQLRVAVAERETAKRELDRVAGLVAGKKLPASEEDRQQLIVQARERAIVQLKGRIADSDSNRPVLEARRAARAADRALIERNQKRAVVRLPHAGIIIERMVAPGDRVAPGTVLWRMIRGDAIEIVLQLPARLYGVVSQNTTVRLEDADTGATLPKGKIVRIAPRIDETQRTFEVFVTVPGTAIEPGVAPGVTVKARVEARVTKDVIAVPRAAFMGKTLYVVQPYEVEGDSEEVDAARAKGQRFVKAVRRTPVVRRWLLDVALIESGLEAGDEYVTSNLEAVAKDSRLRVAAESETK